MPDYDQGARWNGHATRFTINAVQTRTVELCLFDGTDENRLPMDGNGNTFSIETEAGPGVAYGYRVGGEDRSAAKLLLDPFARRVVGRVGWHERLFADNDLDSAGSMPRGLVVADGFDWDDVPKPRVGWEDTVIYEAHVKGLTAMHPEVPEDLRGTYLGVVSPPVINHLRSMGVTTVELLPVFTFLDDRHLVEKGLTNYWGYQPINWFAPDARYALDDPVGEFKHMVRELHRAGIEVVLDVVFNHSGEGGDDGPVINLSRLGGYYVMEKGRRANWTGTGNTLDFGAAPARDLTTASLCYWVEVMGVDGFRFDLATTLGRTGVAFGTEFLHQLAQHPDLAGTKLIAEPWDVGPHGYRLGGFPEGWQEWNGAYRDTVRDFWRGTRGTVDDFATVLSGSAPTFGDRGPTAGISLVTSHDGYTLADLVSYEQRHNQANGESNKDGHRDNRSWNGGVEGPTGDAEINLLRTRRRRALLATLFLSRGVPMLLGGDELGRSQGGNNNAYSQDNETSWYHWKEADLEFVELVGELAALRRNHRVLTRSSFLSGQPPPGSGVEDAFWFAPTGKDMHPLDWRADFARTLGLYLNGAVCEPIAQSLLILFNGFDQPVEFVIPDTPRTAWSVELDTAGLLDSPTMVAGKGSVTVAAFSVVVLAPVAS